MLRYKKLLLKSLDPDAKDKKTMRQLAKDMSMPVPSVHSYVDFDVLPQIKNLNRMAEYYNEDIGSLLSEDSDTTVKLIKEIRKCSATKQKQLLKELTGGR